MGNEEEDSFDDVNSLTEMIGGKKKTVPSNGQKNSPGSPAAPVLPEQPAKSPSGGGDFSQLMKKLGMAKRKDAASASAPDSPTTPPAPADPVPAPRHAPEPEPASSAISSLDDLLEDESPEPVTPPAEEEPRPAIEIIEEDTRPSIRKGLPAKKAKILPEQKSPAAPGTDEDEKIITVDQISDISGLILPKGATFQVDEINLHGRVNAFEGTGIGTLPDEFAEIWKKEFSKAGFKDLDLGDAVIAEKEKALPAAKKFSISGLFAAIRTEEEEYDAKKHGPLVDLSFSPKSGVEEMEMYPVNEPYAYIRIIYDHSTHEYTYQVLEPVLTEPEKDLLKELKERLFDTLDINTKDLSRDEARLKLRAATNDIMQDFGIRLSPSVKEKIHYNMHKDFLGDGLIDPIMHDKYIEDISCDGVHTPIFAFHSSYESMKTSLAYHKAEDLDSFVTKLAQRAGKYISIAEPILDASMQDGSRIQMTLGTEVTAHGSTFTIRKFKDEPITPTDLIEWHTFAPLSIAYIWLAVENGKSAIFAGGTASGKTTALNAISLFIPPMAKIVSLEDTREVKLPHPNWIPSVTRDSFDTSGRGEINMYELLRAAMRQRPEYIIVGEVRGKECQTLFQAMSTGHVTYSTTHADSVASVVHRIENPPMDVPRNMLSALDFICIQVQARVGGKRIRRNKQIVEILDIDPRTNELITNEVFKWRSATDEHSYSGKSYVLEEIMEAKGWNENRMREELKRRQEVLEWMRIKKIRHYKDVAKILISYHRDPEAVIERVRKDLYE
ncbi:MAG: type II/IV secretion system ATPase subunit [Methanoregula sp.]|nr:type II/IV secretion system ATPase subunit [Methanoregula sp.]